MPDSILDEACRWFPPVDIPRKSTDDVHNLYTRKRHGRERENLPSRAAKAPRTPPALASSTHTLPQPTGLVLPSPSTARYWDDPAAFKPARFLGNCSRDALLPFWGGLRGCIGGGFAETEGVAALSLLVAHYCIEVRDEPRFAGGPFG